MAQLALALSGSDREEILARLVELLAAASRRPAWSVCRKPRSAIAASDRDDSRRCRPCRTI